MVSWLHRLIACRLYSQTYCLSLCNYFVPLYWLIDWFFPFICADLVIATFFYILLTHCLVYTLRCSPSICANLVITTSPHISSTYCSMYSLHYYFLIVLTYWSPHFLISHWLIDYCDLTYIAHWFINWCYPICVNNLLPHILLFCIYFSIAYKP